jgi:flagellar hook-length control protein FliK
MDNAAAASSGQDFNTVLARQMAMDASGAADRKSPEEGATHAAIVPALGEPAAADKLTKSGDKRVTSSGDGVTAAVQTGMVALMAAPMVAVETKPVAAPASIASEASATGTGSPGERSVLAQLQADEPKSVAGSALASERAAPNAVSANVAANIEQKFSTVLQAAAKLPVSGQQQGAAASDPAKDAQVLAQSQVQAQSLAAGPQQGPVNAPQSLMVNTPVGNNRWNEDLGQKITWMAGHGGQSAELQLNPPDLGPLNVVLNVSGDQATALFTSPHAAVRDAVQQALPKLREMLADNGIMLGNASVSDQGQQSAQNGYSGGSNRPSSSSGRGAIEVSSVQQGQRSTSVLQTQGLVDTFA